MLTHNTEAMSSDPTRNEQDHFDAGSMQPCYR